MRAIVYSCFAWVILLLGGASGAAQATNATRTLGIPALHGEATIAYDINAAGQVAAVLEDQDGKQRGVLFENGVITELATPGGKFSDARGINPRGEIIGSARNANGTWTAFLFERGRGLRELGTLGGPSSYGMAINDLGHAAGFADTASGDWHAFVTDGQGAMKDLGTLGGKISYAAGLNNAGQVVGTATLPDGWRRAFLHDPARGMIDLGTLGGRSSAATAINDAGAIVGAAQTVDHRWRAFLYENGKMTDLGQLAGKGNSFATDINNAGHVVGTLIEGDERKSWVWRNGEMTIHRGGKGLHLTNAINDSEVVVGATFFRKLNASTMAASAAPVQRPQGGRRLMLEMLVVLLAAMGAVMWRLRSRADPMHGLRM